MRTLLAGQSNPITEGTKICTAFSRKVVQLHEPNKMQMFCYSFLKNIDFNKGMSPFLCVQNLDFGVHFVLQHESPLTGSMSFYRNIVEVALV